MIDSQYHPYMIFIICRHRYKPRDLQTATFRHSFCNDSTTLLQCYRSISRVIRKPSGSLRCQSGIVSIFCIALGYFGKVSAFDPQTLGYPSANTYRVHAEQHQFLKFFLQLGVHLQEAVCNYTLWVRYNLIKPLCFWFKLLFVSIISLNSTCLCSLLRNEISAWSDKRQNFPIYPHC